MKSTPCKLILRWTLIARKSSWLNIYWFQGFIISTTLQMFWKDAHVCSVGKWNVTPLFGHFGGRVGILYFYRSLLSREGSPLSLFVGSCSLFATSTVCVHACRPEGLPKGLQSVNLWGNCKLQFRNAFMSFFLQFTCNKTFDTLHYVVSTYLPLYLLGCFNG